MIHWLRSDQIRSNQIEFYLNSANSQQKLSQNTTCRVVVATLIVVTFQLLISRDPAFYHEQELGEEKWAKTSKLILNLGGWAAFLTG